MIGEDNRSPLFGMWSCLGSAEVPRCPLDLLVICEVCLRLVDGDDGAIFSLWVMSNGSGYQQTANAPQSIAP
jgi:hypothetical protein